jgi:tetratricopeptide (TPR) repeat protein
MQPGELVADRFALLARAGVGGMGEVFRALDRVTGEEVALKVMRGEEGDSERFAREARLLAELRHPGIVRYVASGTLLGTRWLAMEWLEGEDLDTRLAREGLSAVETVELVRRAAEALGAAHGRGVVHRDVKPSNLFLPGGRVAAVKLLDFGIARARGSALETRASTRTGVTMGTPGYMAPEQAAGRRDLDARADVFALGCVLFECLTGRPAFAAAQVMAILVKVLLEDPPRIDEILPGAPPALVDLVARMLEKDPGGRPADGAEVAAALGALTALPSLRPVAAALPGLTPVELRVVSVVLATREAADANADTIAGGGDGDDQVHAEALLLGARVLDLAGGSVVSVLEGPAAAQRAARLALALARHAPIRVALATGRARMVGRVPVGEVIDRAVSLVRWGPLPVAVDEVTATMLGSGFEVLGSALLRERPEEERGRTLMGRATTCVGRDAELGVLTAYFRACVDESRGQAVLVTAPAGVGKSRLAHELVGRLRAVEPDLAVWVGRGDVMRAGSPLGMIKQAIMSTAGMSHGEPIERLREKIAARVARHVPAAQREQVTLFLGEITGASFPDGDSVPLVAARSEAILMADNTRRAWEDFVRAECAAHPVLLVLEDLHWGDGATVSYTDGALRNLGEHPLMVLALARPEVHDLFPRLWAEREVQEVRLGALSRKAGERLVREVLGDRVSAGEVAALVDRAAGNAFFLEELIRAVAEGRGDSVPASVLASVEQRLLSLDPEARRALRAASVLGGTFWDGAVRALAGGDDAAGWLPVLAEAEIVHARAESRFQGQREYAFRHEVVRATAYGMLEEADRILGHRLAAAWFVSVGEQDALIVGEHWEKAGERARAVPCFVRAAEQAVERHEWAAAVVRAERGVASGASGRALGELRKVQAEAFNWAGDFEAVVRWAEEARDQFVEGDDGWFEATQWAISANVRLGRSERVVELGDAVGRVASAGGDGPPRARCLWSSALTLLLVGEHQRAAWLDALAGDSGDAVAGAWRAVYRAQSANLAGDVSAALCEQRTRWALFERANDRRRACVALGGVGHAEARLGDDEAAEATLRRALADSRTMGLKHVEAAMLHNLGPVLSRLGRVAEAEAVEREAVRTFEAGGDRRMEAGSRIYLAEILCAAGDLATARVEATRAVDLASTASPMRPYAQAVLARVERARGDLEAAREASEEAMRHVAAVEEGEAKIRLEHAETLYASGDHEAARAAIATARERLLERAAHVSDPAMRDGFLRRVPEHARTLVLAWAWCDDTP